MSQVNLGNDVTVSFGEEDITVGEKYEFCTELDSIEASSPGVEFIVELRDIEEISEDPYYHCVTVDSEINFTLYSTKFTTHLNQENIQPI